jgi:hypothetical protein
MPPAAHDERRRPASGTGMPGTASGRGRGREGGGEAEPADQRGQVSLRPAVPPDGGERARDDEGQRVAQRRPGRPGRGRVAALGGLDDRDEAAELGRGLLQQLADPGAEAAPPAPHGRGRPVPHKGQASTPDARSADPASASAHSSIQAILPGHGSTVPGGRCPPPGAVRVAGCPATSRGNDTMSIPGRRRSTVNGSGTPGTHGVVAHGNGNPPPAPDRTHARPERRQPAYSSSKRMAPNRRSGRGLLAAVRSPVRGARFTRFYRWRHRWRGGLRDLPGFPRPWRDRPPSLTVPINPVTC